MPVQAFGIALAMSASAALNAGLLLNPGDPAGAMPFALPTGPGGAAIAYHSSAATPDNLGMFTAQVDSAVTVGNSFGANALTFWYRVFNTDQSPDGLDIVSLGVPMWQPPSPVRVDQAAGTGVLSSLAMNTGGAISFFWTQNPVAEGYISSWQAIETSWTSYALKTVGVIDGTSEDVPALVPIPEPSVYAGLAALGLVGFAGFRRFRA
jgi:hypothetical protein